MKKKIALALVTCLLAASAARADTTPVSGKPTGITPLQPEGAVIFWLASPQRTGYPACVQTAPNRYAIPTNTDAGKAMIATLLTAYAMGYSVIVTGNGTCSVWGDAETVHWIATLEQ